MLIASAQPVDTTYKKTTVSETDIKVLFSYYTQNGNHSAVTGGTGTEKLQVYAPGFVITHVTDSTHKVIADFGVDVITSASTDNIDFFVSSASTTDARIHASLGYSYTDKPSNVEVGGSANGSVESDYISTGGALWFSWRDKKQMHELALKLEMFYDDLRWGHFDPDYYKPVKLVYPFELRDTTWFSHYRRTSVNVSLTYSQVLSRRVNFGFMPGFGYQAGLLSTPFHRVFFNDGQTERVEKLPGKRFRLPLAVSLNAFIAKRWILRNYYRFYWDNFGILANTISVESSVKLNSWITLSPLLRFYYQRGSAYFRPYAAHHLSQQYYTSDYDLSNFYSFQPTLTLRLAPYAHFKNSHIAFGYFSLRYAFYWRSDGLKAHIISSVFDFTATRCKGKN